MHDTSPSCWNTTCNMCKKNPAGHLVEEDEPAYSSGMNNFTAFLCCECFGKVMGSAAVSLCKIKSQTESKKAP